MTNIINNKKLLRQIEKNNGVGILEDERKVFCMIHRKPQLVEMNEFPVFDEHVEFECPRCGKNIKVPEYLFLNVQEVL